MKKYKGNEKRAGHNSGCGFFLFILLVLWLLGFFGR
jgi:hypothetical protein